jgi:hypothetical protein
MTELLNQALKAHGGLERWNKVKAINVAASITGAIWYVKSLRELLTFGVQQSPERIEAEHPQAISHILPKSFHHQSPGSKALYPNCRSTSRAFFATRKDIHERGERREES